MTMTIDRTASPDIEEKACPFCNYRGPSLILFEDRWTFVIEPINPVVLGHVLAIPKPHVTQPDADYAVHAFQIGAFYAMFHTEKYEDFNLIMSRGKHATQTIEHLHVHVVPRRENDGLKLPWSKG